MTKHIYKTVRRTLVERLFCNPWNPLKGTKDVRDHEAEAYEAHLELQQALRDHRRVMREKYWCPDRAPSSSAPAPVPYVIPRQTHLQSVRSSSLQQADFPIISPWQSTQLAAFDPTPVHHAPPAVSTTWAPSPASDTYQPSSSSSSYSDSSSYSTDTSGSCDTSSSSCSFD